MGELGALFNPGMRHELEERRAKAARREEEGNARDGDLRIDLESGVAVINIHGDDAAGEDSAGDRGAAETVARDDDQGDGANVTRPDSTNTAEPARQDLTEAAGVVASSDAAAPERLRPRGKRGMSASTR
jgi:Family of unknown function (DUF6191)